MKKYFDLGRWVAMFSKNWVNPFATVFFNFYYLPFAVACKLPIFLYGRPRLLGLKGKVVINGEVKTGMIKLNITKHNPYNGMPFEWINDGGTVIFNGPMMLSNGGRLLIFGEGTLSFGDNTYLSSCMIACQNKVIMGKCAWLAGGAKIFDTDLHFFRDTKTDVVTRNSFPVILDDYVCIFTECLISKGVHLPHHTVVGARTTLLKVPSDCEPYCILGGNPVKVVKKNVEKLLLDWRDEKAFADYFRESDESVNSVLAGEILKEA